MVACMYIAIMSCTHMCIQVTRAKEIMRPFILRRLKKEVHAYIYTVCVCFFLHATYMYVRNEVARNFVHVPGNVYYTKSVST